MVRSGFFVLALHQWELFSRGKNCLIENAIKTNIGLVKADELAFHFEMSKKCICLFHFQLEMQSIGLICCRVQCKVSNHML